jgi:putative IMPACT (imprinted ancient) family translation regulator
MRRTFYLVISKRDDEDFVETIRTEKKSAEQDCSARLLDEQSASRRSSDNGWPR